MRRRMLFKGLIGLGIAAIACAAVLIAQGALAGLGVSDAAGKRIVNDWLESGNLYLSPAAKSFRAAAPASRASLVKNAVAWAKAYTESAEYRAYYDRRRKEETPTPPSFDGTVEDELARQSAERKKSLDEMRKSIAQMPPDMRKSMEEAVRQSEAANRKLETDPQMTAMMRQGVERQRAEAQTAYKGRLESYDRRFPPDPKTLIGRRLQEFLDVSKTVDFDAKLVPAGSKMRFANPQYEQQSPQWKLYYRAGREAVAAARESAEAWRKGL